MGHRPRYTDAVDLSEAWMNHEPVGPSVAFAERSLYFLFLTVMDIRNCSVKQGRIYTRLLRGQGR
jgi:hypothetical protein